MPRGISRYDEASHQRRLWTPDAVRPFRGAWYRFTDPSCLTFSGANISGARDLFGVHDLTTASQSGAVVGWTTGADFMAPHRVAQIPSIEAYLKATIGSGQPLLTSTVLTVVGLCTSAASNNRGLCGIRTEHTTDFGPWVGSSGYGDFVQRGSDSFLTGYSQAINIGYPLNTWFLWSAQVGVNGFLHEVFLNDALTATASADRGGAIGTTSKTRLNIGTGDVWSNEGLTGQLAEIVILTNASNQMRRCAAGYLAHRYKMQHLLPAGHPFKNDPPLIGS